jgi:hypothetical protein
VRRRDAQRAEARAVPRVERELRWVEQRERCAHHKLTTVCARRGERQEALLAVPAAHLEPEGAREPVVEDHVDHDPQLDVIQSHGCRQQARDRSSGH